MIYNDPFQDSRRTGIMEIGLKSACSLGADILGTGMMAARFHCCGVVEVAMDRLKDE